MQSLTTEEKLSKAGETISHNCEQLYAYENKQKFLQKKQEEAFVLFKAKSFPMRSKAHSNWAKTLLAKRKFKNLLQVCLMKKLKKANQNANQLLHQKQKLKQLKQLKQVGIKRTSIYT